MNSCSNSGTDLSTTALAKELGDNPQELFQRLAGMGLIARNGNTWELTTAGKSKGGTYRNHDKYGRYIVWTEAIVSELKNHPDDSYSLLTSTTLGKHFDMTATRTNAVLAELGLIQRGGKGWLITDLGTKLGAVQSHDKVSRVPYVRWPDAIKSNKVFIASIREAKGDAPSTIPDQAISIPAQGADFREKFKPDLRATDGHYVRSKAELLIDNWLYMSELVHAYERKLPIEEPVYSDFYVPSGRVYIEYWGYDNDPKYSSRKEDKLKIYRKHSFRLIELADKDVQNLDDTLPRLLLSFGISIE